jgi:hypothetical protein
MWARAWEDGNMGKKASFLLLVFIALLVLAGLVCFVFFGQAMLWPGPLPTVPQETTMPQQTMLPERAKVYFIFDVFTTPEWCRSHKVSARWRGKEVCLPGTFYLGEHAEADKYAFTGDNLFESPVGSAENIPRVRGDSLEVEIVPHVALTDVSQVSGFLAMEDGERVWYVHSVSVPEGLEMRYKAFRDYENELRELISSKGVIRAERDGTGGDQSTQHSFTTRPKASGTPGP